MPRPQPWPQEILPSTQPPARYRRSIQVNPGRRKLLKPSPSTLHFKVAPRFIARFVSRSHRTKLIFGTRGRPARAAS